MANRTRTRSSRILGGVGLQGPNPISASYPTIRERCDDVIGDYGGNHALTIKREETNGSLYTRTSGVLMFAPGMPTAWHQEAWGDWAPQPTLASLVNRVLATTGPLTPNVNLPLFIYELKDVPGMLRHAGNLLHGLRKPSGLNPVKEAAAANLAWKFGWAPIISDLNKLLGFAEAAKSQQKRIKGAHSSKGIRRRVDLGSDSKGFTGSSLVWSTYGLNHSQSWAGGGESHTWATVRWIVRDPSKYGYEPPFNEALKTSLGLNAGQIPISVWKAIPWTWMLDWFTDISNVLQANYNSIYYKPYRLSIMRTSTTTVDLKPILNIGGNPGNWISGGNRVTTFKYRLANNNPSAQATLRLPFMDNFKMSVLGSLAALKALR
nr:MAG: hypothetical protein 1 [Leviviridae sp.]